MNEDGSEKKKQLYSEQNMPTLCIRFKHFFTVCVEYSKLILGVANQTCLYMILIKMSCHVFRFRLHRTARGKQNPRKRCMKKDRWQNGNFSVFFFGLTSFIGLSVKLCVIVCVRSHITKCDLQKYWYLWFSTYSHATIDECRVHLLKVQLQVPRWMSVGQKSLWPFKQKKEINDTDSYSIFQLTQRLFLVQIAQKGKERGKQHYMTWWSLRKSYYPLLQPHPQMWW